MTINELYEKCKDGRNSLLWNALEWCKKEIAKGNLEAKKLLEGGEAGNVYEDFGFFGTRGPRHLIGEDFSKMPFPKSKGNTNATIAWSIYHIFRIEDIVCNSLINNKTQIFFENDFQNRMNSSIITTGNELSNEQMIDFSKKLNIQELYNYAKLVKENSEKMMLELSFEQTKSKIPEEKKEYLRTQKVADDWLIDYWCGKNIRGLLQMPFSRHWIMHVEACLKIKNK